MINWSKHHTALLNALRADAYVPRLYRRLSRGRFTATDDDVRRLRDWVASLRADPGWALVEPMLDRSRAWPEVWRRAVDRGWSPRSDHHNALVFGRLSQRLADAEDYPVAEFLWQQAVDAWCRVLASNYLQERVERLVGDVDDADPVHQEVRTLLDELVARRQTDAEQALGLDSGRSTSVDLDLPRLRFAWEALDYVSHAMSSGIAHRDGLGIVSAARDRADVARRSVLRRCLRQFRDRLDALDLSEADADQLIEPFEWMDRVFDILPIDDQIAVGVVDEAVELGWDLRRVERTELYSVPSKVLGLANRFNQKLQEYLSRDRAFGHQSKCADFLVFKAEQRSDATRAKLVERALEICPGHRNAAMLLAYERLHEASGLLVRLGMIPSPTRHLPRAAGRLERLVRRAHELVEEAAELYPSAEEITEYRDDIRQEAARLEVEL